MIFQVFWFKENKKLAFNKTSGSGAVGLAIDSCSYGQRFESYHWQQVKGAKKLTSNKASGRGEVGRTNV